MWVYIAVKRGGGEMLGGGYECDDIVGVFSTREKAETQVDSKYGDDYIEEWELR